MLELFNRFCATRAPIYPRITLLPEKDLFYYIEHSPCYGRDLINNNDGVHQVRIAPKEIDELRKLYNISQMHITKANAQIYYHEEFRGSIEVFKSPQKIWLRWRNTMCELTSDALVDLLYELENANERLATDLISLLIQRQRNKPK